MFDSAHLPHGRVEVLVNLEQTLSTMGSIAPGSNQLYQFSDEVYMCLYTKKVCMGTLRSTTFSVMFKSLIPHRLYC